MSWDTFGPVLLLKGVTASEGSADSFQQGLLLALHFAPLLPSASPASARWMITHNPSFPLFLLLPLSNRIS